MTTKFEELGLSVIENKDVNGGVTVSIHVPSHSEAQSWSFSLETEEALEALESAFHSLQSGDGVKAMEHAAEAFCRLARYHG